jgi:hypothetical protein
MPPQPGDIAPGTEPAVALLHDLHALSDYLHQRGKQTYETAQKFADNARRNPETRTFDERQATMLEYQQYIWKEIAGLVDRIVTRYDEVIVPDEHWNS